MENAPSSLLKSSLQKSRANTGLRALYEKELADQLTSKRFLLILLLICGTCCASLYGALDGLRESTGDYIFLQLYTSSGNSIPSFMSFIALLGPFIGLAMGFDAINGERSQGTLNRLLAQPIHRDSIIIGKFLAGTTIIAVMVLAMGVPIGALGMQKLTFIKISIRKETDSLRGDQIPALSTQHNHEYTPYHPRL